MIKLNKVIMLTFVLVAGYTIKMNLSSQISKKEELQNLTSAFVLPEGRNLADVNVTTTKTHLKGDDVFRGKWSILTLGYTKCPDICPMTLMKMNEVMQLLQNAPQPNILFLSIDSTPDKIKDLEDYVGYFNEKFIGITTKKTDLDKLFDSLGAVYVITKNINNTDVIEHTTSSFIVAPNGQYVAILPHNLTAEEIASDYQLIVSKSKA